MKNLYSFLLLLVLLLTNTNSNSQWSKIPSGTTSNLNDIYFIDKNIGFVTGNLGCILKTTNGGDNWTSISPYTDPLDAIGFKTVYFMDENTGFVAGGMMFILKTTNSGIKWDTVYVGTFFDSMIRDLCFVNDTLGFAVGTNVLITTDGGETWEKNTSGPLSGVKVQFLNENEGFIAGYNSIWYTSDAGDSWDEITGANMSSNLYSLCFINSNTGFVADHDGNIHKTSDRGDTWSETKVDNAELVDICFPSSSIGYAAGYTASIYKTVDQGKTWQKQYTGTLADFGTNSMYLVNNNLGFLAGDYGTIKKTENGGGSISSNNISTVNKQMSIYPNPFSDHIRIQSEDNTQYRYQIFDNTGKKCLQGYTSSDNIIQLTTLQEGIYQLELCDKEENVIFHSTIVKY